MQGNFLHQCNKHLFFLTLLYFLKTEENRGGIMETILKHDGDRLEVSLVGNLDTVAAPELEKQLNMELDKVKELVFDLSELNYIASSGLRVLLSSQKRMNRQGKMIVRSPKDDVMDILDMTGFVDLLTIE